MRIFAADLKRHKDMKARRVPWWNWYAVIVFFTSLTGAVVAQNLAQQSLIAHTLVGIHYPHKIVIHPREGNDYVYHLVKKGETLYSIARFYGIDVSTIVKDNPTLGEGKFLRYGDTLRIAIPPSAILKEPHLDTSGGYVPVFYRVQQGETLYGIARRKWHTSVDYIARLNGLQDYRILPGQYLQIGWLAKGGVNPIEKAEAARQYRTHQNEKHSLDQQFTDSASERMVEMSCVGYWDKTSDVRGLYVLHRRIPEGSIIEIINPLLETRVKARVVGTILEGAYPSDIDMVVSKGVADELGILDSRFYAKVVYHAPVEGAN